MMALGISTPHEQLDQIFDAYIAKLRSLASKCHSTMIRLQYDILMGAVNSSVTEIVRKNHVPYHRGESGYQVAASDDFLLGC